MTLKWVQVLGLAAAVSMAGWAQRGNGGGMSGSHGAPQMPAAASHSSHANTAAGDMSSMPKGSGKSAPQSAASGGTIADRITANSGLSSKITSLLPAGMTLEAASAGFKNMGQFIAALHVSKNLGIPFDKLQAEMSGGKSLGQAITVLSPNTTKDTAKTEVKKAENEATQDLKTTQKNKPSTKG